MIHKMGIATRNKLNIIQQHDPGCEIMQMFLAVHKWKVNNNASSSVVSLATSHIGDEMDPTESSDYTLKRDLNIMSRNVKVIYRDSNVTYIQL